MFLPEVPRRFRPNCIATKIDAAEYIQQFGLLALLVENEGHHESSYLEDVVEGDSYCCLNAECLQGRHLGETTDKEGKCFTYGCCGYAWANLLESMGHSILQLGELCLPLDGALDDEHVVNSDGQDEEGYYLRTDHSETDIEVGNEPH